MLRDSVRTGAESYFEAITSTSDTAEARAQRVAREAADLARRALRLHLYEKGMRFAAREARKKVRR